MNRRYFIGSMLGAGVVAIIPAPLLPASPCLNSLKGQTFVWQVWDANFLQREGSLTWVVDRMFPRLGPNVLCGTHGEVSTLYCKDCMCKMHIAAFKQAEANDELWCGSSLYLPTIMKYTKRHP